jgi:hypothetical protein
MPETADRRDLLIVYAMVSGLFCIVGIGMSVTLDEMVEEQIGSLRGAAVFGAICAYLIVRIIRGK